MSPIPAYPEFRRLHASDREAIAAALVASGVRSADYSAFNLLGWQYTREPRISRFGGFILLDIEWAGREHDLLAPIGSGDLRTFLEVWRADLARRQVPPVMSYVPAAIKDAIVAIFPGCSALPQPDDRDYLHRRDHLTRLPGRAFHAKRNFVNRVQHELAPTVRPSTPADRAAIIAFLDQWYTDFGEHSEGFALERLATLRMLPQIDSIGGLCLMVEVENRLVGISLAAPLTTDTWVVHLEKAVSEIKGMYQFLNHAMASRIPESVIWINRESDLGIPGLRQAKLSYQPDGFEEKFTITFPPC